MLLLNELHSPTIGTKMSLGISVDAISYSLKFTCSITLLLLELHVLPQDIVVFLGETSAFLRIGTVVGIIAIFLAVFELILRCHVDCLRTIRMT